MDAPPDKYYLVYMTFFIHGFATLLPWNMFITAYSYFTTYKLGVDYTGSEFPHIGNFMHYLTFCSQIPNVLFNWFNIFVPLKGDISLRIVWSLMVNIALFVITVFLAMVDTSGWPYGFFIITLISVVILNMANGVYQNTIFGMVAILPPKYTGAVILGNNMCGIFTTLVSLTSHYVANDQKMAGIYYFITALFMLLVGFDTYYALPLYRYYRYYDIKAKKEQEQSKTTETAQEPLSYKPIVKRVLPQMFNVWFIFVVTLTIFPVMHADVRKISPNFFIQDDFLYQQILCFLTVNVFAVTGNILSSFITWPSKEYLWIPVTLRVFFIPFYLLCNYQPHGFKRTLPVVINSDYVYWIAAAAMAISSGYFSSLAMMFAPSTVENQHAAVAGMFQGAALMTGVFSGVLLSFLWPWLVSHIG